MSDLIATAPTFGRIPTETIAVIGEHIVKEMRAEHGDKVASDRWWSITQTCRRWRDVLCDSAALWTNVTIKGIDYLQEMLVRSKKLPLTIHGSLCSDDDQTNCKKLRLIMSHSSRIRSLCITVSPGALKDLTEVPHISEMNKLEALDITQIPIETLEDGMPNTDILSRFQSPVLRSLRLTHFQFDDVQPLLCSTLTTLTLTGPGSASPSEMAQVLQGMPDLESLNLLLNFSPSDAV
ncbi:hypothetical protein NEOLEDRAFT_558542 [Neolentinus lepideus HHB14362 ss-1]|uniref:Uncharacterized protein n=1 Tax=Neolentinus lepideus HHB14362 ss-1 TaxID=1314782 RepID=A0A165R633_9AGAM|nr:hypothetical protein NEOLEDRAFT_558542 [Neolentinus lepideus HHB14362 ss-1]